MIPRYTPGIDIAAWFSSLAGGSRSGSPDIEALARSFGVPGRHWAHARAFRRLREGLFALFAEFTKSLGPGTVLMSAQICPVVPRAAMAAGLQVRFVDVAADLPTPSAEAFTSGLTSSTIAVVLAPLYGYMQFEWAALTSALGGRKLVLDLAQGFGLADLGALLPHATAIGLSLGLGKGFDTGGAVLLSRDPVALPAASKAVSAIDLLTLAQALALRAFEVCGLYPRLSQRLARAAEANPWKFEAEVHPIDTEKAARLWMARLPEVRNSIALSRARAAQLGHEFGAHPALRAAEMYFSPQYTHLRQLVRLSDRARRDLVMAALRRDLVDCAAAGERPPWTYHSGLCSGNFPNTRMFLADSIRLPFLGRLTEHQFDHLTQALRRSLG